VEGQCGQILVGVARKRFALVDEGSLFAGVNRRCIRRCFDSRMLLSVRRLDCDGWAASGHKGAELCCGSLWIVRRRSRGIGGACPGAKEERQSYLDRNRYPRL